jgi:laccase
VESGKTYLLRIINAGLANDLFFGVAGHRLTVVGTDARYTKPFTVDHIFISPGQTVDALLEADRATNGSSNGRYYMAARTFASNTNIGFNNSTATAILEYADARAGTPDFPILLPAINDLNASLEYTAMLRSLGSKGHPVDVPTHVDEHMLITLAVNVLPCETGNGTCEGPERHRLAASLNNISFHLPSIDILDAYYGVVRGVYEADFPDKPPFVFNYTDDISYLPTERWVHEERHQGEGAGVRRCRRGGVSGHCHPRRGEPPHAPARVRLLCGREGDRKLQRNHGPRHV